MRHPMPYGDLERVRVQRFAARADLDAARCTIEEREEYEPHLALGNIVYAGVDYAAILARAEAEADLILWDGGNNDFPFVRPDLHIVLVDALRPGDESAYHPGEAVLRMADVVVVAKADAAAAADVHRVMQSARSLNFRAAVVCGASPVVLERAEAVRGKRIIAIEDAPTVTHGGMPYGAAFVAATRAGATIVDPRPWADPEIAAVYAKYPHIGPVLPATGYSPSQIEALRATIERAQADVVVAGTPVDLEALMKLSKPVVRARYEFAELSEPGLWGEVERFLERSGVRGRQK
jgi:predicted GTPase